MFVIEAVFCVLKSLARALVFSNSLYCRIFCPGILPRQGRISWPGSFKTCHSAFLALAPQKGGTSVPSDLFIHHPQLHPEKLFPVSSSPNSSFKHWTLPNVTEERTRTILLHFILLVIQVNQRIQEVIIILTHIATAASGGWGRRRGRRSFLLLLFCIKILSNETEVRRFCALLLNKQFGAL